MPLIIIIVSMIIVLVFIIDSCPDKDYVVYVI